MKHVHPMSLQQPMTAQMEDNEGRGGLLLKSIVNFLIFGINPIFLLFFGSKLDNGEGNNGGGSN